MSETCVKPSKRGISLKQSCINSARSIDNMTDGQQPMFDDRPPDLNQQIAELEREIGQRKRVYPRLIEKGTLAPVLSAYRIRCLEAAIEQLKTWKAMPVPGFKAQHVISTPACQKRDGAEFDEAVERLRRSYIQALEGWKGKAINVHLVMTVEQLEAHKGMIQQRALES